MAKRDGWLVVARGDGWALAWPRERWDGLTAEQQQDVIAAQVALMSQDVAQNGTRRAGEPIRRSRTNDRIPEGTTETN